MNKARLEQLLAFLKEDPHDPFHWYAIANEYRSTQPEKALAYLEELKDRFPDYVPTYLTLAMLLEELQENDRALRVYQDGIDVAEAAKEVKALAELRNAYQNLLFDLD